jgi:intracellular sulfur oxidation DsrE/DsrF family protein
MIRLTQTRMKIHHASSIRPIKKNYLRMKHILFAILFMTSSFAGIKAQNSAQNENPNPTPHKIIFQLSSGDTMSHKALIKQLGNILSVAPDTKIEIVCHGPGLDFLVKDKSVVVAKLGDFKEKGVVFNACEFSMKERNVDKSRIVAEATYVPAGIIAIVSKQEQGWSYIKSGF